MRAEKTKHSWNKREIQTKQSGNEAEHDYTINVSNSQMVTESQQLNISHVLPILVHRKYDRSIFSFPAILSPLWGFNEKFEPKVIIGLLIGIANFFSVREEKSDKLGSAVRCRIVIFLCSFTGFVTSP